MWHTTTCKQAIHDKIRKATRSNCEKRLLDSSYLSVRLSVRMEQPVSHWPDFYEIWLLSISRKPAGKYIFHENFIRITGTLHEDQYSFMIISRSLLLKTINVSDKRCRRKKHILCSIIFFFRKSFLYEITWKNIVEPDRTQMTIWLILCSWYRAS
jgi:hypothetical protein